MATTTSNLPKGTHATLDTIDAQDTQLHYPKGFVEADGGTMPIKHTDDELYYTTAIITEKIEVTSSELLAISTTPKTLIPAQGAGTTIKVLGVASFLDFGTTAYSTTDNLKIKHDGGSDYFQIDYKSITGSSDAWFEGENIASGLQLIDNKDLILTSASDPTGGDGTLYIFVTYQVLKTDYGIDKVITR